MSAGVRSLPVRVKTTVEMFSDVVIRDGETSIVVQVKTRWWLYDDDSYYLSIHRAGDPLENAAIAGDADSGLHVLNGYLRACRAMSYDLP